MIGAVRCSHVALAEIAEAVARGLPPEPAILNAHAAFARNAAETWSFFAADLPNAEAERERALREQLDAVSSTNALFFDGSADADFDQQCRAKVKAAFHARIAELKRGWRQ